MNARTEPPPLTEPDVAPFAGADAQRRWRRSLAVLAAVLLLILAWYAETLESMVEIWASSATFNHGFLVAPVALWLIWRKRHRLAAHQPQPAYPVLGLLAAAGVLWLTSSVATVSVVSQFALVFMIQFAVWSVLGTRIAREMLFPLGFLLFAVPAGEFLLPVMISMTADFTVSALRATGIPVYREGMQFVIPSGGWSVVEACAGLRYLVASLMVGTLFAHLNYRSPRRRLVFVAASIVVPIVANWLRAYMIVMIGHLTDNRLAVGIDHFIYGWVFFGFVMLLMFWIGSWYQEHEPGTGTAHTPADQASSASTVNAAPVVPAALAAAVIASIWPPLYSALEPDAPALAPVLSPLTGTSGWKETSTDFTDWKPFYLRPRAELRQVFEKGSVPVGLYVAFYSRQKQGEELINSLNVLVSSKDKTWSEAGTGEAEVIIGEESVKVAATQLRSLRGSRLAVWNWYWVGGRLTSNAYFAKLLLLYSKLRGRGDDSAAVIVYTPRINGYRDAEGVLAEFVATMSPAIEAAVARTSNGQH